MPAVQKCGTAGCGAVDWVDGVVLTPHIVAGRHELVCQQCRLDGDANPEAVAVAVAKRERERELADGQLDMFGATR